MSGSERHNEVNFLEYHCKECGNIMNHSFEDCEYHSSRKEVYKCVYCDREVVYLTYVNWKYVKI